MPPNLSKVLYHWGMEKDVLKIGLKSAGIELILCEYSFLITPLSSPS